MNFGTRLHSPVHRPTISRPSPHDLSLYIGTRSTTMATVDVIEPIAPNAVHCNPLGLYCNAGVLGFQQPGANRKNNITFFEEIGLYCLGFHQPVLSQVEEANHRNNINLSC